MISLTVDESLEHKRNVLKEKARTFNEGKKASEDFSELHAISENYFKNKKDVLISFVAQIADNINLDSPQIYRDFDKILSLIETHALLHQEDREKTTDNKVIATLEDYEVIWNLIEPVLELSSKKKITKEELEKVLETMLPHAGEKTIQFMIKYSLGGMLYLWWRPANLILSYLYDDEVEEVKPIKKNYTRREILQLAFLPILK